MTPALRMSTYMLIVRPLKSQTISAISKACAAWSKAASGSRSNQMKIWCTMKSRKRMSRYWMTLLASAAAVCSCWKMPEILLGSSRICPRRAALASALAGVTASAPASSSPPASSSGGTASIRPHDALLRCFNIRRAGLTISPR